MDDLIYFLFLIAWLAFSFYQQSAKKKKKQEQMRAEREREQQEENFEGYEQGNLSEESQPVEAVSREQKPERDFKKTLEEILLGEEFSAEISPEPEQSRPQPRTDQALPDQGFEFRKNDYQKYYDDEMLEGSLEDMEKKPQKLEDTIKEREEDMVLLEDHGEEDNYEKSDFDLRKAIIYSEIINRRYTN